jgi:SAM domain (Sterile alpha motif)/Adenylate and Guanylate cyclase catalytic domain
MQQIADWLKNLGMSEYADCFAKNHIDLSALPDLTGQDLEKLGVLLGDRRKMLRAITALNSGAAPAQVLTSVEPPKHGVAERRQLTVMFCDLVGSTALSARLDPEDLREIIGSYHRCCSELIERNGGFVAKYMGDGVLTYFGYPQADEHDAERAVRAGFALVEAVPKITTPREFLCKCVSESQPDSSWSAISSARAPPRSRRSLAKRRTLPLDSRGWPSRPP